MPLHEQTRMDYQDGGVRLSTPSTWQVACDLCGFEGTRATSQRVAELGFEVHEGRYLCAECSNQLAGWGDAPLPPQAEDPTEAALMEAMRAQYPAGQLNFAPGSVLRALISTTALAINRLQHTSEGEAQAHLHREFAEQAAAQGMGGRFFERLTESLAQQAVAAQQQTRSDIIRAAIDSEEGRRRLAMSMVQPLVRRRETARLARELISVDQLPQGAVPYYMPGDPVAPLVAAAESTCSAAPRVEGPTRWERLLREGDPFE